MAATCVLPQGPAVGLASLVMALWACTESSFSCPGAVVLHHPLTLRQQPFRRHHAASAPLRAAWLNTPAIFVVCHLDIFSRVLGHSRTKEGSATSTDVKPISLPPASRLPPPRCASSRQAHLSISRCHSRRFRQRNSQLQTTSQGAKRPAAD